MLRIGDTFPDFALTALKARLPRMRVARWRGRCL